MKARRPAVRGFTLTELMVVITLIGVLAVIGVGAFRRQVSASKTTEVNAVVEAIRAAQEAYRAEHQTYLDVSTSGEWYPANSFGEEVMAWQREPGSHPDQARWERLHVVVEHPVQFRYRVSAGVQGDPPPALQIPNPWSAPTEAWYIVQARADYDNDGVFCLAVAGSFNNELYVENEGE